MTPGEAFAQLRTADVRALTSAVGTGRLAPPFSVASLARILGLSAATPVAAALQSLSEKGWTVGQIASCLDMLADASESRSANDEIVELVMTSPADSDAYHRDTKVVVTDLFRRAEKSILVAGFAVHQGRRIFRELAARMREVECLQVRIFLNLTTSHSDVKDHSLWGSRFASEFADRHWPKDHPLPELYFDRRVLDHPDRNPVSFHAKCVVRDKSELFVSSANFTEAAQNRNIEMGLIVQSAPLASQAVKFFGEMVREGICIRAL